MDVIFEKISPTPAYPAGVLLSNIQLLEWESKAASVVKFKSSVKSDLRTAQVGRCCYCRRALSDDIATHIEHFIEKSSYPMFKFEIQNLALSCGICNTKKNGFHKKINHMIFRRANRIGGVSLVRNPTLVQEVPQVGALPTSSADYRWVHPHFDLYSQNIVISKGWIFEAVTSKGYRTIRCLDLNALARIEMRALQERLSCRGGALSVLVAALPEFKQHTAREIGLAVSTALRALRNKVS